MAALDWVLARHVRSGLRRLDPEVRAVLRLGLHDAVMMNVPAAVATDSSIHLVRGLGKASARGLVNAVLRRAIASWDRCLEEAPEHIRLSHPSWLAGRWQEHFGMAAARQAMRADQEPAPLWVWLREPGLGERLQAGGTTLEAHPWCPGAWRPVGDTSALIQAIGRGEAYAQDPASQLVAHLASRLLSDLLEGDRDSAFTPACVDLCSAPGGKAALLEHLRPEVDLVCVDIRLTRLRLVDRLLSRTMAAGSPGSGRRSGRRTEAGPGVVLADSTAPPFAGRRFSLVMLDAPCSGSGTLRRHPELRWRSSLQEINRLTTLQSRLLGSAFELVAPGGLVLYTTCSVEPEENEALLNDLGPGLVIEEALASLLPSGTEVLRTEAGGCRLLPTGSNDGFTIHAIRRIE
jgi:16S rRNA (cytosine967-C5)-methyltransferase